LESAKGARKKTQSGVLLLRHVRLLAAKGTRQI
jgi:hypothetical protein